MDLIIRPFSSQIPEARQRRCSTSRRSGTGAACSGRQKGTTYLVAGHKVGKAELAAALEEGPEVIDGNRLRELLLA